MSPQTQNELLEVVAKALFNISNRPGSIVLWLMTSLLTTARQLALCVWFVDSVNVIVTGGLPQHQTSNSCSSNKGMQSNALPQH